MSTVGMDAILANQRSVNTGSTSEDAKSLGKDEFLKLLVKQLQYQDPLNPVENTDFTAQLAQFTSLETLSNIDENISHLGILQNSINNMNAVSFIGKQVHAQGNAANYTGSDVTFDFKLSDFAAEVTVNIYDSDGQLVRTMKKEKVAAGDAQCVWDGKDDEGNTVSEGKYLFAINAADYDGASVNAVTYTIGQITGVRYEEGITYLIIGDKEVNIANIKKIEG
jgi:flagellar basal-body rod modification protein FlgD